MKHHLFLALLLCTCTALARDKRPVERLVQELAECEDVKSPACRQIALRLSNYGKRAVQPLSKSFSKLSPAGQILGLVVLGEISHRSSTRALIRLSRRSTLVTRALALASLGTRAGRNVDSALLAALKDRHATIRAAAAEAIGRSQTARNTRRVVPGLVRAAKDEDIQVQVAVLESLGMLGDKRGVPPMRAALRAEQPIIRKTALFALRFVSDRSVVPELIRLLREDDGLIVQDAGKTLEKITGLNFGTDYELWKEWWKANKGR